MQYIIYEKKHFLPSSGNLELTARFFNWYWRTCCIQTSLEDVFFCEALWAFHHSSVQERVAKPIIIIVIIIINILACISAQP